MPLIVERWTLLKRCGVKQQVSKPWKLRESGSIPLFFLFLVDFSQKKTEKTLTDHFYAYLCRAKGFFAGR